MEESIEKVNRGICVSARSSECTEDSNKEFVIFFAQSGAFWPGLENYPLS